MRTRRRMLHRLGQGQVRGRGWWQGWWRGWGQRWEKDKDEKRKRMRKRTRMRKRIRMRTRTMKWWVRLQGSWQEWEQGQIWEKDKDETRTRIRTRTRTRVRKRTRMRKEQGWSFTGCWLPSCQSGQPPEIMEIEFHLLSLWIVRHFNFLQTKPFQNTPSLNAGNQFSKKEKENFFWRGTAH